MDPENKDSTLSLLGPMARQWCLVQLPEFKVVLEKLSRSPLNSDQQAWVERLEQMARGFQQLLRLGLSIPPDGEGEGVNLESECRRRMSALQRLAQSRGLSLRTQFDGLISTSFKGRVDEALLILELLIERALVQVEEGGVDVAIRGIDSAMGHRVEFRIMDTGPGMGRETQECLWKGSSDWNREPDRLVLNLLKRRTEEVGGSMGVESKEGVGNCFWFEWPLVPVDTETPEPGAEEPVGQRVFIRGGGAHQFRSLSIRLENLGFLPERLPEDPSTILVSGNHIVSPGRQPRIITEDPSVGGAHSEVKQAPILVIAIVKESGGPEDKALGELMERFPSMRVMVIVSKGVRGDSNHYQVLGACAYLVQSISPPVMKKLIERMLEWEPGDPLISKNDLD